MTGQLTVIWDDFPRLKADLESTFEKTTFGFGPQQNLLLVGSSELLSKTFLNAFPPLKMMWMKTNRNARMIHI